MMRAWVPTRVICVSPYDWGAVGSAIGERERFANKDEEEEDDSKKPENEEGIYQRRRRSF